MLLPLQDFDTLVEAMAAGVQGAASQLIDFTVGSVLRALMEACASVALWLQWLILQVLSMTRAATSSGADLDSWMADFSFTRLPGVAAAGQVTFYRYTPGIGTVVPVGQAVSTADRSQSFLVTADPANPAWSEAGYTLAANTLSVTVPVQAATAGASGNVQPDTIVLLLQPLPGIDGVANAQALAGGADPESDAAFRTRFQAYINSRAQGTALAIEAALSALRQGLRIAVAENQDTQGLFLPGHFCVVLDDGTGNPPASLLQAGAAAVDAVRPIGATYAVIAPSAVPVTIALTVLIGNPLTAQTVKAQIASNIAAWVNLLPIAGTLALSRLDAIAHNTDGSVQSVEAVTVNGGNADIALAWNQVFTIGAVTVS